MWARRILAEKDGFKTELAAVQSGISGTLRLGVEPTASTSLAQPVAAFCAAHPLARVRVESRLSASDSVADYGSSSSTRRSLTLTTTTTRACTSCRCMKNGTLLWPLTSD